MPDDFFKPRRLSVSDLKYCEGNYHLIFLVNHKGLWLRSVWKIFRENIWLNCGISIIYDIIKGDLEIFFCNTSKLIVKIVTVDKSNQSSLLASTKVNLFWKLRLAKKLWVSRLQKIIIELIFTP